MERIDYHSTDTENILGVVRGAGVAGEYSVKAGRHGYHIRSQFCVAEGDNATATGAGKQFFSFEGYDQRAKAVRVYAGSYAGLLAALKQ